MTIQMEVAELGPKGESLIDNLAENGGEICFTRDGKAIAKLVSTDNTPAANALSKRRHGPLAGSILYQGDIVSPLDEEWDAEK